MPFRKKEFNDVWIVEMGRGGSDRVGPPGRCQLDARVVGRRQLLLRTRLRLHCVWLCQRAMQRLRMRGLRLRGLRMRRGMRLAVLQYVLAVVPRRQPLVAGGAVY